MAEMSAEFRRRYMSMLQRYFAPRPEVRVRQRRYTVPSVYVNKEYVVTCDKCGYDVAYAARWEVAQGKAHEHASHHDFRTIYPGGPND